MILYKNLTYDKIEKKIKRKVENERRIFRIIKKYQQRRHG